ncbi:FliM/FliN family flagellar motor switch protein [Candidatus Liberibacter solanacearum]|uniref:Flagellar motor switch protein FliM n=1 Tax=Candidatus Liberibacter solanacearum TaxID=556287 RepID=A0A1V2N8I0_9HYPH|nr:FliM/FliN family flagellar motor switch protein [Candidatus Liberibacter solanacearum]ONI59799.1 flagellar C-ring protein [Candidatus Liberibacter solanacearum]ONI60028.1 flagellar C-ring protein [Candidatus Liberibacter solanacearum]
MREKRTSKDISPLHPVLLARLTGKLGDRKTIERISYNLGQLYTKLLPKSFKEELDVDLNVSYGNHQSGKFSHILHSFKERFVFYKTSLNGGSSNLFIGCSNNLVIVLLETLLRASCETTQKSHNRSLSTIEKKLAHLIVTKIATVLDQCISTAQNNRVTLDENYELDFLKQNTNLLSNEFVTAITMVVTIDNIVSLFTLIIPQETLLKITLISLSGQGKSAIPLEDYPDQLNGNTYKIHVKIESRINLQKITLKDVLNLKIGQVMPFLDKEKVYAILNANGKEIYACELGRIGKNYTVRIQDRINFDQESLRNFLHKE